MSMKNSFVVRQHVADRDGSQCFWCGCSTFEHGRIARKYPDSRTLDHLVPKSKGGTNEISNLLIACFGCNQARAAATPEEWMRRRYADHGAAR